VTLCPSTLTLPAAARTYITLIEDYLEIPIEYISVGTLRNQTIKKIEG
jgi:adenylosuccinate synthase